MMLSIFVVLFAVMFLIAKIVDTIISSSDVYGWITKCQRGNETLLFAEDNITSSTVTLISTISFWWSGGMVILFGLCAGCSLFFYFIYEELNPAIPIQTPQRRPGTIHPIFQN